jgi:hypothetical protein
MAEQAVVRLTDDLSGAQSPAGKAKQWSLAWPLFDLERAPIPSVLGRQFRPAQEASA